MWLKNMPLQVFLTFPNIMPNYSARSLDGLIGEDNFKKHYSGHNTFIFIAHSVSFPSFVILFR